MRKTADGSVGRYGESPDEHHDFRITWDSCLRADVDDYMAKNATALGHLVDMLLDGRFTHARYTDPEYPIL
jgi:hypothetical protein